MRNFMLLLVAALALLVGCSRPPTVQFENLSLVASLRTACSAKNEEWLVGVERAIKARHAAGAMSDAEKAHFEKLINRAKNGDWQGAEKQCYQFERAQLNRTRPDAPATAHAQQHPATVNRLSAINRQ